MKSDLLKGVLAGVKASIISSSCCTLPLVLVIVFGLLGAGSVAAALKIPRYKIFFIAAGTAFLMASTYFTVRKKCGGKCRINDVADHRMMIAASAITYVLLTYTIIYLLLPAVSEWIFL